MHRARRQGVGLLVPVALSLLAGRCNVDVSRGEHTDAASSDARGGTPEGGNGPEQEAGSSTAGAFACGGVVCTAGSSGVQSFPCCTDAGDCGLRIVLSPKCLGRSLKGGVDSRCTPFEIPGQITLPGCCSPTGCGALATFDGIGCIPNPDVGRDAVPCTPSVPFQ